MSMYGTKVKDNYYWINDKFMYFTFNGVHSSLYHLFIVNNNKELQIENTIGAQSSFSNAFLQEGTYYLGTSATQKTFKRSCATEGLTLPQYKQMIKWLTPGTKGELVFDSNPCWGWDVVVDTVGDAKFYGDADFMYVQLDITFKTIGTYLAHNIYPITWETIDYHQEGELDDKPTEQQIMASVANGNSYKVPALIVKEDSSNDTIYLYAQDICNRRQGIEFTLQSMGEGGFEFEFNRISQIMKNPPIDLEFNNIIETNYVKAQFADSSFDINYNTQTGLLLVNGQLAEKSTHCNYNKQLNGLPAIECEAPEPFSIVVITQDGGNTVVTITPEDMQTIELSQFDYFVLVDKKAVGTKYGDAYNNGEYTVTHDSYIGFNLADDAHVNQVLLNTADYTITFVGQTIPLEQCILVCGYTDRFSIKLIHNNPSKIKDFNATLTSYNNM